MSRSRNKIARERDYLTYEIDPCDHPTEADKVCIPLKRRKYNDYRLYITRTTARFYTDDNVPDFIKLQVVMLDAMLPKQPLLSDDDVHGKGIYRHRANPELPEMGWRISPSYYVLVLTKAQVKMLDDPDSPCNRL